jgi:hypothetical protein
MNQMRSEEKHSNTFLLVSMGLLIGFFMGAGIVYYFFQKLDSPHLPFTSVQAVTEAPPPKAAAPKTESTKRVMPEQTIPFGDAQILGMTEFVIHQGQAVRTNQILVQLDSLLGKTREQSMQKNTILIAFYDLPNEQPGYIMSPKRISFFGISEPELVSIRLIEETFYLEYMDYYFELHISPDFTPLLPVWDEQAIADLQKLWN